MAEARPVRTVPAAVRTNRTQATTETGHSLGGGATPGGLPRQEQLGMSGLLLAAHNAGRGEQIPDGAEDAEDAKQPPRRVARHGVEVAGGTDESVEADVVAVRAGELVAGDLRRVPRAVGEGLRGDIAAKDESPPGAERAARRSTCAVMMASG
jgi:hypothetical protein